MLIPLEDVRTFSTCPAYYHFALEQPLVLPTNRRISILQAVVQKMYLHQMGGTKPEQRKIIGWVDKEVFKDIAVDNEEEMARGLALSESVLRPLRNWYERHFLKEHTHGYANLEVEHTSGGHQVTHTVPLVKATEPPTVLMVGDAVQSRFQLYNNVLARGSAWLVARKLQEPVVKLEYLYIGPRDHIEVIELECTEELNSRAEKMIFQIADQVAAGVNYPSYTPMCNGCPYRKECIL